MDNFTKNVSEDDDLSNERSKEYNDLDIEAILERSRNFGYRRSRPLYEAPEFAQRLESFIEVIAGGAVMFQCQWKACPRPQIKWFKDDEEISPDHPYFTMETDDKDGYVRLKLTELSKQDEGAYKCKAENQEGVASTTGYLSVTADGSEKTLNSQQKAGKPNNNSPTSPNISLAPHLCTILEQKSLEEREGEAQRRLPPSPLQDYIDTVQKTKTWPLAKMGYNPDDFMSQLEMPNGVSPDDNDDAQSSSSDTSVDSQPETVSKKVTTSVQPRKAASVTSITKVISNDDTIPLMDSAESDNESEEDDSSDHVKPVCTVSVQVRSESGISRLTKIRQEENRKLSLTITADSENSDDSALEDSPEEETPRIVNEPTVMPKTTVQVQSRSADYNNMTRKIVQVDKKKTIQILPVTSVSNNATDNAIDFKVETDNTCAAERVQERNIVNSTTIDNDLVATEKTLRDSSKDAQKIQSSHQKNKDRRLQIKKQKSMVEIGFEWLFQRITGKVGENLELPWIYYFAFTVMCGCLCAAIRLNPFYMIIIVAFLSVLSFRFILSEKKVTNTEDSAEAED